MKQFLQLETPERENVFIDADAITAFRDVDNRTCHIFLNGSANPILVKENHRNILQKLKALNVGDIARG